MKLNASDESGIVELCLHGSWLPEQRVHPASFAVWGEMLPPDAWPPRAGRSTQRLEPLHPFATPVERLRSALAGSGFGIDAGRPVVRLPSADAAPLPSDETPGSRSDTGIELRPYRVDAVTADAVTAAGALLGLAGEAPAGVRVGEDLRFWALAARFALDLLSAEQFMPELEELPAGYRAAWRPLIRRPEDRARLKALAAAMPAVCRALAWNIGNEEPAPQTLLESFLSAAVDGLARQALSATPPEPASFEAATASRSKTAAGWLTALCSESHPRRLPAFARLHQVYRKWRSTDDTAAEADSFRVCFRLDPPAETGSDETTSGGADETQPWTLEFLLQATDDPSLLVSAGDVWRRTTTTGRFLDRRLDRPHERLLAALGRATRLFPPIERSLEAARPEYCPLTVAEAYTFVRESALLLRESGYGVLVPGLQSKIGLRLKLRSKSVAQPAGGPAVLGWDSLVQYDWQLAIGDQTFSREEFEALARLKEPLLHVRGRWVELNPDQVKQALALFRQADAGGDMTLPEALRVALAPDGDFGLPVLGVETEGWIDDLVEQLRGAEQLEQVESPPGFVGQLRPYQQSGVTWLAALNRYRIGACLADDMGLGKTVQIIALLLHQRAAAGGSEAGPTLLICPTSVVGNWSHELSRFAPELRVLIHHGAERARSDLATDALNYDIVVSTYALLHRDLSELSRVEWLNVVLDEAQNIKNPSTRAAQAARSLRAGWRVALTGTPIENRLTDLWSLFQFLVPGYLGSNEEFRRRFATPIERGGDSATGARLKALVAPFMLRRLKTDRRIIDDLPEKNEMKVFCTICPEQATLYEAIVRDSIRQVEESEDGLRRRGLILSMISRLKQVCDHPVLLLKDGSALTGRSGKLSRLTEMLEEVIAAGDRALIFTQFAEMGALLRQSLQDALRQEVLFLYGGTPARERDRMVRRFQAEGSGPQIFVLSIKAGGTGLNLTRANHVFHFDRWWNPAVENQATDRAFRIGQRRDVQVHKFICAGTFEQAIDEIIERKTELSRAVIGTSENWITEMSTDELRGLLALRAGAVQE